MVLGALMAVCVVLEGPGNKLDFCIFWDLPLGPQDPVLMELEGKKVASWGPVTTSIKTTNTILLVFKTPSLQTATCKDKYTRLHDTRLQRASSAWWPLTSRGWRIYIYTISPY